MVRLPCREWTEANRGAGKGEPDGPLKAAITIARCMQLAKRALDQQGVARWSDIWYLDDGQIALPTTDVGAFLAEAMRQGNFSMRPSTFDQYHSKLCSRSLQDE